MRLALPDFRRLGPSAVLLAGCVLSAGCGLLAAQLDEAKAPVDVADRIEADDPSNQRTEPDDERPIDGSFDVAGCNRKTIGEEFGPLAVAYSVVDGRLSPAPCLGEASAAVEDAWRELAAVSPIELLDAVVIVAGFTDSSDTLAYAAPVDNDSDEHLIALAIDAAIDDPQELRLTMAHELAHVFTQTPDQIDVAVFDDECDTFFNGFGCFQVDAYMTAWIDTFWSQAAIAGLPADYTVDIEGGEDRCDIDPSYPGSYAASHPEEDFAESFSAYVFDVELPPSLGPRLAFFDQYPEFVRMREAVRALDEPVPPGNFDRCG